MDDRRPRFLAVSCDPWGNTGSGGAFTYRGMPRGRNCGNGRHRTKLNRWKHSQLNSKLSQSPEFGSVSKPGPPTRDTHFRKPITRVQRARLMPAKTRCADGAGTAFTTAPDRPPDMNNRTSALLRVIIVFLCSTAVVQAQQLRTQYPEIRLSDKRVLTHARVESFDGISFCISHDGGIEAAVDWAVMPPDWRTSFPYSTERKAQLRNSARSVEAKNQQIQPGSLKPSVESRFRTSESAAAADREAMQQARDNALQRAITARTVLPGMTEDQCVKAWGEPRKINQTVTASGVDQQWVYSSERYLYLVNGVLRTIQGPITAPEAAATPSGLTMRRSW